MWTHCIIHGNVLCHVTSPANWLRDSQYYAKSERTEEPVLNDFVHKNLTWNTRRA